MNELRQAAAVLAVLDKVTGELLPDSSAAAVVRELALPHLTTASDEAAIRRVVGEVVASDTVKPLLDGVPTLRFRRVGI